MIIYSNNNCELLILTNINILLNYIIEFVKKKIEKKYMSFVSD